MKGLFGIMRDVGSGMSVQRTRMSVAAANLANASTTRTPEGGPYRRRGVVIEAGDASFAGALDGARAGDAREAVRVRAVVADARPPRLVLDPGHPDAGPDGMVAYPNIDPVTEMIDLMLASRAYEANASAGEATRGLIERTLEILR